MTPDNLAGIPYLETLEFESNKIKNAVLKRCRKLLAQNFFSGEKLFLGNYYRYEIKKGICQPLEVLHIGGPLGYGVFARKAIAKGAFICEVTGVLRKRSKKIAKTNDYLIKYPAAESGDEEYVIDTREKGNYARFVNHSFEPNCEIRSVFCEDLVHVLIFALKEILQDEQLTCNYGEEYWQQMAKKTALPQ